MNSAKKLVLLSTIFALVVGTHAQGVAQATRTPQKLESFGMTSVNGPWLVMVTVFADENENKAYQKAVALVKELRYHRMNAYIYAKKMDSNEKTEGRPYWVVDRNDPTKAPYLSTKYRYMNKAVPAEFAVLVGDFKDLTDPAAEATLKKIRSMTPQSLGGQPTHSMLAERDPGSYPLRNAFLVANPMIKRNPQEAMQLDETVLNANKGIKRYSLLDCPGQYSVQVAVLKGVSTLNQGKIRAIMNGSEVKTDQTLAAADEKAIRLCEMLRKQGVEAYVFRDHYASIVTVGSFSRIGEVRNGEMVLDPAIMKIFRDYSAHCDPRQGLAGIRQKTLVDKELGPIPFDITPKVIVVPRRPIINTRSGLFSAR